VGLAGFELTVDGGDQLVFSSSIPFFSNDRWAESRSSPVADFFSSGTSFFGVADIDQVHLPDGSIGGHSRQHELFTVVICLHQRYHSESGKEKRRGGK